MNSTYHQISKEKNSRKKWKDKTKKSVYVLRQLCPGIEFVLQWHCGGFESPFGVTILEHCCILELYFVRSSITYNVTKSYQRTQGCKDVRVLDSYILEYLIFWLQNFRIHRKTIIILKYGLLVSMTHGF